MNKLSIWILTSEFPPMYGGGISTYCHESGLAWSMCGHRVKVFTRADPAQEGRAVEDIGERYSVIRVPIVAEPAIQNALGFWHLMSYCLADEVVREIRERNDAPDMIEVQDYGALGYFLLKRKLAGCEELVSTKIVVYTHTPVFELVKVNQESSYLFPNYWLGQCEKFCLQAADSVISPSRFLKRHLESYCRDDIKVIPYPFFLGGAVSSAPKPVREPEFDCVYAGRLEYRKGVLQLLAAFKGIWDSGEKVTLHMVGGDTQWVPRRTSMKSYIEKLYSRYIKDGLITFSDAVPPDVLPSVFSSGKVVVIPSIYENFPYVCMQAMGLGNVVLVSASGGQAEMVGGDASCGLVFDWDEPGSFSKQLKRLLRKSSDELVAMGDAARRRISMLCNYERFVERRIDHLNQIGEHSGTARGNYPRVGGREGYGRDQFSGDAGISGKLSVVVPFYNMGRYILESVESIDNSSYPDIEIIIVNDGSDDESSVKVLEQLRKRGGQVKIIDIDNAGLANARNVGARAASGEFLAFLDADDCIESLYYEKCIGLLTRYQNISFVYSWVRYFGESDAVWINFDTEFPYLLAGNMLAAFQVVRRNDFLEFGINDEDMMFGMEDYEAWLRMVSKGCHGVTIPEPLVRYRVRDDSMARQFNRSTVIYMYEQMVKKNNGIYKEYGDELFMLVNANGPGYLWNNPTIAYPPLAYAGSSEGTGEMGDVGFSIGEMMRLKRIVAHPVFSRLIRFALSARLDRWFGVR